MCRPRKVEEPIVEQKVIRACCRPISDAVLAESEAEELAMAFKLLSDPVRLRLLSMIANSDEVCACDLTEPLGRSQPTISHHLSLLTDAGLVTRDKRGKWAYYQVAPDRLALLRAALGG
jgi:ArsR family transcriptional regulator, arsenate/arsenite/antimonite-responsive transcriptional repressor